MLRSWGLYSHNSAPINVKFSAGRADRSSDRHANFYVYWCDVLALRGECEKPIFGSLNKWNTVMVPWGRKGRFPRTIVTKFGLRELTLGPLTRDKFHLYKSRNADFRTGISSKFGIFSINLPIRGYSALAIITKFGMGRESQVLTLTPNFTYSSRNRQNW